MPYPDLPEFDLDEFEPVDASHERHYHRLLIQDFKVLGEHHTPTDTYFIVHDEGATWGVPGTAQLRAIHVSRDLDAGTYEVDSSPLPLYPMAESYLIARGCPAEALAASGDVHTPADDITRALEARVRGDGDHFALLAGYTDDLRDTPQTVVMLRSLDPKAVPEFRILLEEFDQDTYTHTLREGGFATYEAATAWWGAWADGEAPALPSPALAASPGPALAASPGPAPAGPVSPALATARRPQGR
ncbi:hypothetical protein [Streptomyces sp. NBC_00239]|uniref:hypothetical protein n=1 Tax=Streptomyces sp. NBC_00239 TaxID=2903640 RepID=UPI002E2BAB61|nr:hypothetical protein [Streptomyces sp. NBC_00239]